MNMDIFRFFKKPKPEPVCPENEALHDDFQEAMTIAKSLQHNTRGKQDEVLKVIYEAAFEIEKALCLTVAGKSAYNLPRSHVFGTVVYISTSDALTVKNAKDYALNIESIYRDYNKGK